MVREISWTKNILIFEKCKDDLEREFYIRMTRKFGWTKNVLAIKIETNTYENTLWNGGRCFVIPYFTTEDGGHPVEMRSDKLNATRCDSVNLTRQAVVSAPVKQ